jgi:hypothetical protein
MLSAKDKKGLGLIAAVIAALIIAAAAQVAMANKSKAGPDNCTGEVTANTVLLLDYSEQITDQTLDEIVARAMSHVDKQVRVNERVSVFAVSELSTRSLKPIVSLCKPPADGNRLVENVQQIHKRFRSDFEQPIRAALSTKPSDLKESPIAQALTDISLSQYLRGSTNTLLVFSDMLENTPKFSLYRCADPEKTIAAYREARAGAVERPEFKNTEVKLNIIPRLDLPRTTLKCRDQLWPWFFGSNTGAAASLSVDYLPGGAPMNAQPGRGQK